MTDRISKSNFGTFSICQRKYYYDLLGFESKATPEMKYGIEFHEILEKYNNKVIKDGLSAEIKVPDDYKQSFATFIKFLDRIEQDGYERVPFAVEFPVKNGHLFGYIDAIFKKNDHYLIVDYKTVPELKDFYADKYTTELAIYKYAFGKMLNIPFDRINVAIMRFEQHSDKGDFNYIEINEVVMKEIINKTVEMYVHIQNSNGQIKDFPQVSPTKQHWACRYCNYAKEICK